MTLFGKDFEKTNKLASTGFEQGALGDNYFLTMLAALADKENIIPNLFHQKKYTHEGIFALKVYVKGRPEDVTVDDLFPIYNNQPAFAKPTEDGGWWVPLLEKAYAKVNINYETVSSGSQAEAARFLTGAPSREFKTNYQSIDELWDSLTLNLKKDFVITTACFVDHFGLMPGQGFVVKGFLLDGNTKIIKMKSPWKKQENSKDWSGKYSKLDKNMTEATKKAIGFDKLKKGEFLMTLDDFRQAFNYYTVVYLKKMENSFIEKKGALNKKNYRFNFTITDEMISGKPPKTKTKAMKKKKALPEVESEETADTEASST